MRLYLLEAPEKATKDLTPGARNANNCFSHAQTGLSHAQYNIVSRLGRYTPWHLWQNLKRNEPLEHEKDKAEPEKKKTAERESIKQSGEPEKKWIAEREKYQLEQSTAERKKYQEELEKKRVAKRQRYWKSSEPGCLRRECDMGRLNIHWNAIEEYYR